MTNTNIITKCLLLLFSVSIVFLIALIWAKRNHNHSQMAKRVNQVRVSLRDQIMHAWLIKDDFDSYAKEITESDNVIESTAYLERNAKMGYKSAPKIPEISGCANFIAVSRNSLFFVVSTGRNKSSITDGKGNIPESKLTTLINNGGIYVRSMGLPLEINEHIMKIMYGD